MADQTIALLRYANYAKVARDLSVSRQTVMRWSRGEAVTPWQLRRLRELFGVADTAKEPPPEWARALPGAVAGEVMRRLLEQDPEVLAMHADLLEGTPSEQRPSAVRLKAGSRPRDTSEDNG